MSIVVDSGEYQVDVYLDAFEPLSHIVTCAPNDSVTLHYILRLLPPDAVDPDSLGLMYLPQTPSLDPALADRQMRTYSQATEFFAVFPLAQGILVKAFMGTERSSEANVMIGVGAGLSLGSLALGKIFSSRKRSSIRRRNEEIQMENEAALTHNQSVERQVRRAGEERLDAWSLENRQRGRVSITRR